jgi:maltose alpha-D-glucosyltransferase/alpha-amylase
MADRYIWKNREFDPAAGPTEKNYVHNFFWFQPALNFGYARPTEPWQDPVDAPGPLANREALREIMAYWMDLGAAGFRVDMASSLVKEDDGHRETIKLWQGLREWLDHHYPGRVLIAEWSYPSEATEAGFHLDFLMHFNLDVYRSLFFNGSGTLPYPDGDCYFDKKGTGTPHIFLPTYLDELGRVSGRGLISMPTANHDFQHLRCGNRDRDDLEVAWVFLMSQAGPPTIYMGDEIGMRFVEGTPPKEGSTLKGVTAPNAGSPQGERAGTRTPMQWDASANAGFSTASAEDLYLPLDPDPERPHVAAQEGDPDSLLNFVRRLIRLRQEHPALGTEASFKPLTPPEISYPLVVERRLPGEACLILLNPSSHEVTWHLPPEALLDAGPWLEKSCCLEETSGQWMLRIEGRGYAIYPLA